MLSNVKTTLEISSMLLVSIGKSIQSIMTHNTKVQNLFFNRFLSNKNGNNVG